ncbi:MAG: CHAT domain-containing protein, partial [Planctomycetes bacterium]|nr:CHAT domain-containing protein [Planctomycetota bacterium]
ELMTEFDRRFLDERQPPATALRGAKLHLLRHTEWKEPRYWAAFTLAGDWR